MTAEPLESWRSAARDLLHGADGVEEDAGMAARCYLERLPPGAPASADDAAQQAAARAAVVAAFVADVRDAVDAHGPNRLRDVLMTLSEAAATASQEQASPSAQETSAHCGTAAAIAEMLSFATVIFVERKVVVHRGTTGTALGRDPGFRGCCSWARGSLDQLRGLTGTVCLPDASAQVSLDPNATTNHDDADDDATALGAAASPNAEALAHVLFLQASRAVTSLAESCHTVWINAAAVLLDVGAAAIHNGAGSPHGGDVDALLKVLGPLLYASLATVSAAAAALAQSRPVSSTATQLAAVTQWLERAEAEDAERTAVSELQRQRIAERRQRITASRQARAAMPIGGGGCGGCSGGPALHSHSKELSDWMPDGHHSAQTENAISAAFNAACDTYIALRQHARESPPESFFTSAEALRASAPLAFLARAVGAASGDTAAVEDSSPSTTITRRRRAYESWVSSKSLPNALRAASREEDAPPAVDMVAFARGDRAAVERALADEQRSAAAGQAEQVLLADLCTDSDDDEDADDADAVTSSSYEDEATLFLTSQAGGLWLPPLNAEGFGILGLLDPAPSLAPRARFERIVLPCIALLRSSSAAAKVTGIVTLGAVVRGIPSGAVAVPGVAALSDLVSSACAPCSRDEDAVAAAANADVDLLEDLCTRLLSSCEDTSMHRYFLLLQELVNAMVSCPTEAIRRPASLLVPAVLRMFSEDVALRLTFALIHRCPYASGTADLVARVLKRAVEISTATVARAIRDVPADAGGVGLRAAAVTHLTGPGRSAWLSPAAPWLLAAVAKRWAQSAGSIDMHGDSIVASLNLVRYWTAVDRRYLCGSVLLASTANAAPSEKPYSLELHADRAVLRLDFAQGWPSGSPLPLKPRAGSSCRAIADKVLAPVLQWLSRRQNDARTGSSREGGPSVVSISGSALGSFALESAAAGLAEDFGISQRL